MKKTLTILAAVAAVLCSCAEKSGIQLIPASDFETEVDGKATSLYTLKGGDITVQITNFGARVVSIWAPGRDGSYADVATGYDKIDYYIDNPGERFLGAVVGPVANRIGKGTYTLDGVTCDLSKNNNGNTLHGGFKGIDMLVWDVLESSDSTLVLSVVHPDGLDGFPGNLSIKVKYTTTACSCLKIEYEATTDQALPVNLSNHAFFNLTGCSDESILGHEICINASRTTPVDSLLIPTGEVVSLDGSPLDFRTPKTIGQDIEADDIQLKNGNGYDHNWCLDRESENGIELACTLYEPVSGREMKVYTDQPGLQFYAGNFFDGTSADKYGRMIVYRGSLALETQKWPDAINNPEFPDTVLRPGETYTQTCIYKFGTR